MINRLVIRKPIITEKSLADAAKGIFAFEVDKEASKLQIKKEIERIFKVHVQRITSVVSKGKKRRAGKKRMEVNKPDKKKARVRLAPGEKIDLFEVGKST